MYKDKYNEWLNSSTISNEVKEELRLIKDDNLRDCFMKEGKCFMPWIKIPVSWVSLRLR